MRDNKKYARRTINFGKKGDKSREIIKNLEKRLGGTEISNEIRKAIEAYYSKGEIGKKLEIERLKSERKEIKKQMAKLGKELETNADELNKLGEEPE